MFALSMLASSCYMPINGIVVDAETNQPVEGAVVLVEWTKAKGFGLTYTESYKVAEALSDKSGKFELPGCYSPFVNDPNVTIYKKGYVAWNNKYIFPNDIKRSDYIWKSNVNYEMRHFMAQYYHDAHISFINNIVLTGPLAKKKQLLEAVKWEEEEALKERRHKK